MAFVQIGFNGPGSQPLQNLPSRSDPALRGSEPSGRLVLAFVIHGRGKTEEEADVKKGQERWLGLLPNPQLSAELKLSFFP